MKHIYSQEKRERVINMYLCGESVMSIHNSTLLLIKSHFAVSLALCAPQSVFCNVALQSCQTVCNLDISYERTPISSFLIQLISVAVFLIILCRSFSFSLGLPLLGKEELRE